MSDIENAISKFFDGEASPQEEQRVRQFKLDYPEEFNALKSFWEKRNITHSEFNADKAWETIQQKTRKPKRIIMYQYIRRVAAVAAILIVVLVGSYVYLLPDNTTEIVEIQGVDQGDHIKLSDGTIVHLNEDAVLYYPKTFESGKRIVSLTGEAFFDVAKDPNRPFIINTTRSKVEVLGTSFNVHSDKEQTEVSVTTGKVKVENISTGKSTVLLPNQSAFINKQQMQVETTNNANYLSWKTGIFKFENNSLDEVIQDLTSYYGSKIRVSSTAKECSFTSSFNQRELKEILEIIQLSCGLKLKQNNGNYELY